MRKNNFSITQLIDILKQIENNSHVIEFEHNLKTLLSKETISLINSQINNIEKVRIQLEIKQSEKQIGSANLDDFKDPNSEPGNPIIIEDDQMEVDLPCEEEPISMESKLIEDQEMAFVNEDSVFEEQKNDWEKSTPDFMIDSNEKQFTLEHAITETEVSKVPNKISGKKLIEIFWKEENESDSEDEMIQSFNKYSSLVQTINQVNQFRFSREKGFDPTSIPGLNCKKSEIEILKRDIEKCESNVYINDVLVNFYMTFIESYICPDKKIYSFNSYFSNKLLGDAKGTPPRINYNGIKRYSKKVDIMEQDFIIIPIWKNDHWTSYIVWYPIKIFADIDTSNDISKRPWILFFDSIRASKDSISTFASMDNEIVQYIYEEFIEKKLAKINPYQLKISEELKANNQQDQIKVELRKRWSEIMIFRPAVPTQYNAYDCGIFMLEYVERFLRNSDSFLQKWFSTFEEKYTKFQENWEKIKRNNDEVNKITALNFQKEINRKLNYQHKRKSFEITKKTYFERECFIKQRSSSSQNWIIEKLLQNEVKIASLDKKDTIQRNNYNECDLIKDPTKNKDIDLNYEFFENKIDSSSVPQDSCNINEKTTGVQLPWISSNENLEDEVDDENIQGNYYGILLKKNEKNLFLQSVPIKSEFTIKVDFSNWFGKFKVITMKRDLIYMLLLVLHYKEKLKNTQNITIETYEYIFNLFIDINSKVDKWDTQFKDTDITNYKLDPLSAIRNPKYLKNNIQRSLSGKDLRIDGPMKNEGKYDKFISHILEDEVYWNDEDNISNSDNINFELKSNPHLINKLNSRKNDETLRYREYNDEYNEQNIEDFIENSGYESLNNYNYY